MGNDRTPRVGDKCECDDGWAGINCNVCQRDDVCDILMPENADGVCYPGDLVVRQNYQMCDVTNKKILEQLKGQIPQVTFSCNAEDKACSFQCKFSLI